MSKREKATMTTKNDNSRRIIEINVMDEPTYEDINQMKDDDDDEEQEEYYPTGYGINDDDWVRLFEISYSAYAAATTSLKEQVEKNLKDNHIKIIARQKKQKESIFKKCCCKQVEPPSKKGRSSTGNMPWRKVLKSYIQLALLYWHIFVKG